MKLIVTNDDGIDAPGIQALAEAAHGLGEIIIIAPVEAHSGCSHKVTTDRPLRVEEREPNRLAVHGTPSDCARVALLRFPGEQFVVLSGCNDGANLGVDVWHSGTVAAVREAVIHGKPGMAFSQYRKSGGVTDWKRTAKLIRPLIQEKLGMTWMPAMFWNINLPHLEATDPDPKVVHCPVDPSPLPLGYHEEGDQLTYNAVYFDRRRQKDKDIDHCFRGNIAVSRLSLAS